MDRRAFIYRASGLALTIWTGHPTPLKQKNAMDRIAMGTVLFRYRFKQTLPAEIPVVRNELKLTDIPDYYQNRFGIRNIEFWSKHFESLTIPYLKEVRQSIRKAGSRLINVQVDESYNLASKNETERRDSVELVKKWIDAVSFLDSKAIRINPGNDKGSIENSIRSMTEVNHYAKQNNVVLLNENHFGIEMNPALHLRIIKEAGPENIYTLPDYGNYEPKDRMDSLKKIIPYAYLISAKAERFNADYEHFSFDFDACVKLTEELGFKGIYSVEQWSGYYQDLDYEKVGEWLIRHVKSNIRS